MSKTFENRREAAAETIFVALDEIQISDSTLNKLLRRDHGQIEKLRESYENGDNMIHVILRPRFGGGYNVEEGRHRVIAAKLAGQTFIESVLVGSTRHLS